MWKQIVGVPSMDSLVKKPDVLSFHIASKIPVSESTRQELLDIDGITYRLRREIELLDSIDLVRCRICQVIIFWPNPHSFAHHIAYIENLHDFVYVVDYNCKTKWYVGDVKWGSSWCLCESWWLCPRDNDSLQSQWLISRWARSYRIQLVSWVSFSPFLCPLILWK